MRRIYKGHGQAVLMTEEHEARREKIRRQKVYLAAAIKLQRTFRMFSAKCVVSVMREVKRIRAEEELLRRKVQASGTWWTDVPALPVAHSRDVATGWTEKKGVRLPPIKTFGRSKDYLSFRGWGRKGNNDEGEWVPTPAALLDKRFLGDSHVSRIFIDKLDRGGYDEKRMQQFKESRKPGAGLVLSAVPGTLAYKLAHGYADEEEEAAALIEFQKLQLTNGPGGGEGGGGGGGVSVASRSLSLPS